MANGNLRITNTCGRKGVYWEDRTAKWVAQITVNSKHRRIGRFDTLEQAAIAYDDSAKEAFGEFAATNRDLGLI